MCGRYYMDEETLRDMEGVVQSLDERIRTQACGDRYPSGQAGVIMGDHGNLVGECQVWGFPYGQKKGVIFNARSESVMEKPMFRECVRAGRCVIPAKGFYEWNRKKERFTFTLPEEDTLYLAGICKQYPGERRFVILTMQADEQMSPVHDRMPLIFRREQLWDWILDGDQTLTLLRQRPPRLQKRTEYEQQVLPL